MLAASVAESNALVLCLILSRESLIDSPGALLPWPSYCHLCRGPIILVNDKNGAKV